jgi:hypothetical protein
VRRSDGGDDSQPQASTALSSRTAGPSAPKALERLLRIAVRETGAVIAHANHHRPGLPVYRRSRLDRSALWCVRRCVPEQLAEHTCQLTTIPGDLGREWRIYADTAVGVKAHSLCDEIDKQSRYIDSFVPDVLVFPIHFAKTRKGQQVIYENAHPGRLGLNL